METEANDQMAPNFALPFEILSKIFTECLWPWYEPYNEEIVPSRRMEATNLRRAAQVCQYWRAVALELPEIWGTIINTEFDSVQWTQELIRRSGDAPLVVQFISGLDPSHEGFGEPFRSKKWSLLFGEIHRIRILHLYIRWSLHTDLQPLEAILSKPAPVMESLKISPVNPNCGYCPGNGPLFDLSTDFLAAHTPRLRELEMSRTGLVKNVSFSRMELVSLTVTIAETEAAYTPAAWLIILNGQPQLRYFLLYATTHGAFSIPPMPPPCPSVSLPNLEFLSLSTDEVFCGQLLPKITLPSFCLINLDCYWERNNFNPIIISGIIQGLAAYFDGWKQEEKCLAWTICLLDRRQLLSAYEVEDADVEAPIAKISFWYNLDRPDFLSLAILRMLQTRNLMSEAESLKFELSGPLNQPTTTALVSLLKSCKQTREVILMEPWTVKAFVNTIRMVMDDTAQPAASASSVDASNLSTGSRTLFPNLKNLVYYVSDSDEIFEIDHHYMSELLFGFLRWRRDVGRRIPNLSVCVREPKHVQFMHDDHSDLELDLDISDYEHGLSECCYRPPPCVV